MKIKKISFNESPVRKATSIKYRSIRSLSEAKKFQNCYLIMEGDFGGQIYVVAPITIVKSDEKTLKNLLSEIDNQFWKSPEGAKIFYEQKNIGEIVAGGMGGGVATSSLWVHPKLDKFRNKIKKILEGKEEILS